MMVAFWWFKNEILYFPHRRRRRFGHHRRCRAGFYTESLRPSRANDHPARHILLRHIDRILLWTVIPWRPSSAMRQRCGRADAVAESVLIQATWRSKLNDLHPIYKKETKCDVCGRQGLTRELNGWWRYPAGWWILEASLAACSIDCVRRYPSR